MTKLLKHQTSQSILTGVPETEQFNPARLTLARKRHGLTKGELAVKVKVDLRAIVAYEAGEYPPSDDTLRVIASKLEFPIEFFFGPNIDEPSAESASFRALTKMKASHRDMALAQGALAIHLNSWLEKKFDLPPSALPDLSRETSPEAAAVSLRRYWGIGELAIRNMVHLLEAQGVRIFSLTVGAREVDAFSLCMQGTPFIFSEHAKDGGAQPFRCGSRIGASCSP